MTTTTIPITITCPDWCEVPADEHAGQLWDMEGVQANVALWARQIPLDMFSLWTAARCWRSPASPAG